MVGRRKATSIGVRRLPRPYTAHSTLYQRLFVWGYNHATAAVVTAFVLLYVRFSMQNAPARDAKVLQLGIKANTIACKLVTIASKRWQGITSHSQPAGMPPSM